MSKESALAMASHATQVVPQPQTPNPENNTGGTKEGNQEANEGAPHNLQSTPFSHLAKKEADLVRRRQEFKKEQDAILNERKWVDEQRAKISKFEELKANNPVEALKYIGFSEADIFNYLAAQQKPEQTPEEKAVEAAKLAAQEQIKAFEEAQKKKEADALKAQDQVLIEGFKSDLGKLIASDKEKYEYCNFYGKEAEDIAYETTVEVVRDSKGTDIITPQEAIELVESYFEEKDKEMMGIKKRAKISQPQEQEQEPTQSSNAKNPGSFFSQRTRSIVENPRVGPKAEQPKPAVQRTRTLTNQATATMASAKSVPRNETPDQKKERLIQKLLAGGYNR